jgi:hypothetical protein
MYTSALLHCLTPCEYRTTTTTTTGSDDEGDSIVSSHSHPHNSQLRLQKVAPKPKLLFQACQVGASFLKRLSLSFPQLAQDLFDKKQWLDQPVMGIYILVSCALHIISNRCGNRLIFDLVIE